MADFYHHWAYWAYLYLLRVKTDET